MKKRNIFLSSMFLALLILLGGQAITGMAIATYLIAFGDIVSGRSIAKEASV